MTELLDLPIREVRGIQADTIYVVPLGEDTWRNIGTIEPGSFTFALDPALNTDPLEHAHVAVKASQSFTISIDEAVSRRLIRLLWGAHGPAWWPPTPKLAIPGHEYRRRQLARARRRRR